MLILRSLLVTLVFAVGIAAVIWLVSMIPGNHSSSITAVAVTAFVVAWFWVYHSLKDHETRSK